jgi:AAA+ ATPase superfamily predicted ATPase
MPKPTRLTNRAESILNGFSNFVGREEELNRFAELVKSQTTRIGPIIVFGPGGIGKTALVTEFLRRSGFESEWIDVNEMLAYRRENPEERSYRFIERLLPNRGRRGRFIAVLDGVDILEERLAYDFIGTYILSFKYIIPILSIGCSHSRRSET